MSDLVILGQNTMETSTQISGGKIGIRDCVKCVVLVEIGLHAEDWLSSSGIARIGFVVVLGGVASFRLSFGQGQAKLNVQHGL